MGRFLTSIMLVLALVPSGALAENGKLTSQTQNAAMSETGSYLTSPALRRRALKTLFARVGANPMVGGLTIGEDEITLIVQNPGAPHYADRWTVSRLKFLLIDNDQLRGPEPERDRGIVDKAEGMFFPLSAIGLDGFDALLAAARTYAGMEGPAALTGIEVSRAITILPKPAYGDIRWTLRLATPREQATVYADAKGTIIGGDLSGTTRVQRLNLLADDDWPTDQAQTILAGLIGSRSVHELRVYDSYLFVTVDHASDAGMTEDFSWNLSGIRKGLVDSPNFIALGLGDRAAFAFSELDLTRLPAIKAAARRAYDDPSATITGIYAKKPTDRAGPPVLIWDVDFRSSNGEKGEVLLDAAGTVLQARLPDSRLPAAGPWLAPETLGATLARLEKEFGPEARYAEILINDRQGTVLVEDPREKGVKASFIVDARSISRFGMVMPYERSVEDARSFTLTDIRALDPARFAAMASHTLARMKMEGLSIDRFTISRQALIMNPEDNRLLIEVRASKDDGWTGGWVTFDLDGNEVDAMLP